jgi:DNA-binding LytR/AlgR family response regulator
MLKAIIVDDEELALDELSYLLESCTGVEIIGAYTNPVEALGQILIRKPDVAILDIEMPMMSGLNLAKEITEAVKNIEVIFITAFDGYAIKAFEVNAVDYMIKPVLQERLVKTIDRIKSRRKDGSKVGSKIIDRLNSIEKSIRQGEKKYAVWGSDGIFLLNAADIIYITIEGGNTVIYSSLGQFTDKKGIDAWEKKLGDRQFFRCHRSFLVNIDYIKKIIPYGNNSCTVLLKGKKEEIPVSRGKTKELKSRLGI